MGAIARINRVNNLLGDEITATEIPQPEWINYYSVIDVGYKIANASISGLKKVDDPRNLNQDTFWINGSKLHLIYNVAPTSALIILHQIISTTNLREVAIAPNFTVFEICSTGLTFKPGSEPGQFTQKGNILSISTSPQYNLVTGQEVSLVGNLELAVTPSIKAVNFVVEGIDQLDAIDWLGCSFLPAANIYEPQVAEFLFRNNATIFTEKLNLPAAKTQKIDSQTISLGKLVS